MPAFKFHLCCRVLLGATLFSATAVTDEPHPGEAIYDSACAECHDRPEETRAPALDAMRQMRFQAIAYAINEGRMREQADHLSDRERLDLVEYLVGKESTDEGWIDAMMCSAERSQPDLERSPSVAGFGFDKINHRFLTARQAGLDKTDFGDLELAWAMGFPDGTTMRSQPVVQGSTLFLPVADVAKVFAIDIAGDEPCLQWVYRGDAPMRTSAAHGVLPDGRQVLAVGDQGANIHLLDARTGERLWKQYVGVSRLSLTTGTPVFHENKLIVPVSQYEISVADAEDHVCCTSHGAVTALEAESGEKLWTAHTMEDAEPVRDRGDGQEIWGPSGAPVWNSPLVDAERNRVYVGTGEATSEPAHENTNAILAIDMDDGEILWSFQATPDDIYIYGCGGDDRSPNCPRPEDTVYRDVDFGASLILGEGENGRDLLFAGQKSGALWALDPSDGSVVWRQAFGKGSSLGGIHWGLAYDGERIFTPINRPYSFDDRPENADQEPGMHGVRARDGEVLWTYAAQPDCSGDRQERVGGCANNIGMSGAPTAIGDVVVEGALDGFLRALDAQSGELLFEFDTARPFETVNGVEASGGSIDNASIVAANGYLFVNSGYGMFGQVPGNVILAFRPSD